MSHIIKQIDSRNKNTNYQREEILLNLYDKALIEYSMAAEEKMTADKDAHIRAGRDILFELFQVLEDRYIVCRYAILSFSMYSYNSIYINELKNILVSCLTIKVDEFHRERVLDFVDQTGWLYYTLYRMCMYYQIYTGFKIIKDNRVKDYKNTYLMLENAYKAVINAPNIQGDVIDFGIERAPLAIRKRKFTDPKLTYYCIEAYIQYTMVKCFPKDKDNYGYNVYEDIYTDKLVYYTTFEKRPKRFEKRETEQSRQFNYEYLCYLYHYEGCKYLADILIEKSLGCPYRNHLVADILMDIDDYKSPSNIMTYFQEKRKALLKNRLLTICNVVLAFIVILGIYYFSTNWYIQHVHTRITLKGRLVIPNTMLWITLIFAVISSTITGFLILYKYRCIIQNSALKRQRDEDELPYKMPSDFHILFTLGFKKKSVFILMTKAKLYSFLQFTCCMLFAYILCQSGISKVYHYAQTVGSTVSLSSYYLTNFYKPFYFNVINVIAAIILLDTYRFSLRITKTLYVANKNKVFLVMYRILILPFAIPVIGKILLYIVQPRPLLDGDGDSIGGPFLSYNFFEKITQSH